MQEHEKRVDLIALEQHFPQNLEPCYDSTAGDGFAVRVDRGQARRPLILQVFPDTQVARLSTALVDVTLRQATVAINEDNDFLQLKGQSDEEWVEAMVQRNGAVTLATFPNKAAES